jgi:hypothetical protein
MFFGLKKLDCFEIYIKALLQRVLRIWFGFRLKPIFNTARFKCGRNRAKNNHLASLILIRDTLCTTYGRGSNEEGRHVGHGSHGDRNPRVFQGLTNSLGYVHFLALGSKIFQSLISKQI